MPTYEFICKDCDQKFEKQNKLGDYEADCPLCGKKAEKLMSAPNVVTESTKTADVLIGQDAEKKWQTIEEQKNKRTKEYFGNVPQSEIKEKNQQRLATVLNKQNVAYKAIHKAKEDAGITKKDELNHLLKG